MLPYWAALAGQDSFRGRLVPRGQAPSSQDELSLLYGGGIVFIGYTVPVPYPLFMSLMAENVHIGRLANRIAGPALVYCATPSVAYTLMDASVRNAPEGLTTKPLPGLSSANVKV